MPLPDLIPMIEGAPRDVVEASQRLACSTCVLVNIGVDREDLSNAHMTYFYDEDICFTRLSFPHMLSANNAPPGAGAFRRRSTSPRSTSRSRARPRTGSSRSSPICAAAALLRENDKILFARARCCCRYANIIFDLERDAALETVHGYLDDIGIAYCGRYGDWGYMWTDESFISGERAAERVLSSVTSSR